MKTIAFSVDILLYALVALTLAIILYKVCDLWLPRLVGKRPVPERLGTDAAQLDEGIEALETGMTVLAVLASSAPFIGLAGTVMHIIEALRGMGLSADMSLISGPIATALNSTLVGLASAIPSAVAYNLLQRHIQVVHNRHERRLGASK